MARYLLDRYRNRWLEIDGDDAYVKAITKILGLQIAQNLVGAALLSAIAGTGKTMTIKPYTEADAKRNGQCNAYADPDDYDDASPEGPFYSGEEDDPNTEEDERYNRMTRGLWIFERNRSGNGSGSDVDVHFTDRIYGKSGCSGGVYGSMPDEVLVHEMFHGLRAMLGVFNRIPTDGDHKGYLNQEEFHAIVVANTYISAKGSNQLRADHNGHTPLAAAQTTSRGFLADTWNAFLVWRLTVGAGTLPHDVSLASAVPFNPIAEFMANPGKYVPADLMASSKSQEALIRYALRR
jgi:hypothetical protein